MTSPVRYSLIKPPLNLELEVPQIGFSEAVLLCADPDDRNPL
jgi:hypothetical protein